MRKILLLALSLTIATIAQAQSVTGGRVQFDSIPGIRWIRQSLDEQLLSKDSKRALHLHVRDSATNEPLPNVYVNVKAGKNSYNFYTDMYGALQAEILAKDSIDVLLSYMGYNTIQGRIPYPIAASAFLTMKKNMLSQIIVKGNMVAIVNNGDTVSFNAAAFKTMKGDRMVDLFKKFPGMTFENGILMYMGSPIDQIRFDNKALFGNDAHLALETMWADEAIRVDVFKEESEFDKRNGIIGEKTRTIANVTTRTKPDKVVQTNLTLLAGYDIESSSKSKYATHSSVDGTFVNTSEKRTINARVADNSNANSNGRMTYFGSNRESLSRAFFSSPTADLGHKQNLMFKYDSRGNEDLKFNSQTFVSRNQLITDSYNEREYLTGDRFTYSNNYKKQTYYEIGNHESIQNYFKDNSQLTTDLDLELKREVTKGESGSSSMMGDKELMNSLVKTNDKGLSTSLSLSGRYSKMFKEEGNVRGLGNQLHLNYSIKHTSNNSDSYRVDTSSTSTNPTNLVMDGKGYNNNISFGGNWNHNISDKLSSVINFGAEYKNSLSKKNSVDYFEAANGKIDTLNSYNYTINDFKARVAFNVGNNINITKGEHWSYNIGGSLEMTNKQRDERFPNDYSYPRTFWAPSYTANIGYRISMFSSIDLRYSSNYFDISLEQLRPYVDNSNIMFAKVGNPDLKMPCFHSLSLSLRNNTKKGVAYNLKASYIIKQNTITTKNLFFTEDTYFEKYNYTAPSGSTLSTVENINGNRNAGIEAGIDGRINPIKSRVTFNAGYGYSKSATFVNMNPSNIYSNSYYANFTLNSMFSSSLELSFDSTSRLEDYSNVEMDSRSFSQIIGLNMKIIPTDIIKLGLNPIWNYYTSNANDHQVNNCLINGSLEFRIGKKKRNAFLLNVYDILNTNETLKVTMFDDYIQTTMNATLGRYFMAGFRLAF